MTRPTFLRLRRWAAIAAAAVALYALFGFFAVPPIARSQIVKQARALLHREATVRRVRFNPFTFAAVLEGLDLRDRDGAELFKLERLTVNFQLSSLFRRAWTFREITIEQPQANARLLADGRLSVRDLLEPDPNAKPAERPSSTPRLIIAQFTIAGGSLTFEDASRTPTFVETFAPLDLAIHDLVTLPNEKGEHTISIGFEKAAQLHWTGRQSLNPVRLDGRFEVTGIRLARLWGYALPGASVELREGRADLAFSYAVQKDGDAVSVALDDASLALRDVALRPRDGAEDWLTVPLAEARGIRAAWPASTVDVAEVRLTEPRGVVLVERSGRVNWQDAFTGPGTGAATPAPAPGEASTPWTVKIAKSELVKGAAHLEDRTKEPAVPIEFSELGLSIANFSSDLASSVTATASTRINGSGEVKASGTLVCKPFAADLDVAVSKLDLVPFNPYLKSLPGAEIKGAAASLEGKLKFADGAQSTRFEGSASLDGLHIAGAGTDRLVSCDQTRARGIVLTLSPNRLKIREIGLDRAFVKLFIDRGGQLNLSKLGSDGGDSPSSPTTAPARPASPRAPFPVEIGAINIRDAKVDFTDESLILPFGTNIHGANGSIRDLSTTSAAAARLDLEGRIAEAGFVKAGGSLRIADPYASTDVGVAFRGVDMSYLTPYVAQFAGYSIKTGSLDLDVRYRIENRRLVGSHKALMTDLVLGPKVEGAPAPSLPVRLAIALLKDKDGRINLDVPVEGTIDSPEFAYRKIFWQAVRTILGNVAKAPFRAIGRMFGKDEEDLDLVGFASGRSDLLPPEQETLAKIAAELAQRDGLTVEVAGRYDPVSDAATLRRDRLEAKIDAKRTESASLESILEALYAEAFTREGLVAERAKFQPQGTPFDAAGFYDAVRAQLLQDESIGEPDLVALAQARAAAVIGALTAPGGLDPAAVTQAAPAPVKRKKQGSDLVASEMTLSAKD